ncbi:VirB8/TrbF family protein [Acidithiobacillus sp.]
MNDENQQQDKRYLAARREWLEREGDNIARAKNWRMMAFAAVGIAACFGAGMIYEADRVHVVPYVVEVNKLGASVHLAQAVDAGTYQRPIVAHVLTHWIWLVRSRTPDVATEKTLVDDSYDYVDKQSESLINAYFKRHSPYIDYTKRLGGRTVKITSALPIGKLKSTGGAFQINWTETQYDGNGGIANKQHYQGIINYAVIKPGNNPKVLAGNPFGIYVTTFNWNPTL